MAMRSAGPKNLQEGRIFSITGWILVALEREEASEMTQGPLGQRGEIGSVKEGLEEERDSPLNWAGRATFS
jgi:hypothetical protein